MRTSSRSGHLLAAGAAMLLATSTLLLPAGTAGAGTPIPGETGGCSSGPTKFYKTGSTIIGVITLSCDNKKPVMEVMPVISRSGGGAGAKTFYMKPARECSKRNVCVATFGIEDVRGTQTYTLQNEPYGGTFILNTGGAAGDGSGSMKDCQTGIYCTSWTKRF